MTNTLDWLAHRAQVSPQKLALIFEERRWTYEQLNRQVAQMAAQLAAAGVERGQHVAVLMSNRAEYVFLIHALARLGVVMVPLNIRLTPDELRWQVCQADCAAIIYGSETAQRATSLADSVTQLVSVDEVREPGCPPLLNISVDASAWASRPLDVEATQGIVFTSGTTGQPKGAMLTFNNHLWSAMASAYRLGTDPTDRWLACMPLFHVGGIAIIFRCCLYGTAVVLHNGFNPVAVSRALDTQQITLISVVPTMLHRLIESHRKSLAASALRCVLVGGAATSPALVEQCLVLKLPVATTYGLTEAASQVATATLEQVARKPGTVGKPLLFSQVRILDEAGQEMAAGEIGNIAVSGPTVMQGYYRQPDATQKTLRNGQLHTGDLGYLDDNGDLWVVQRRADLIVTGGENVYPVEVEQVLAQHPNVTDACVIGLNDDEWGQRVAAAVVIDGPVNGLTDQTLVEFCRERLAGYKLPKDIRFLKSLPQTSSGKIHRDKVKEFLSKVS